MESQNATPFVQDHGYKKCVQSSSLVEKCKQPNIRFVLVPSSSVSCCRNRCLLKRLGRYFVGGGRGDIKSNGSGRMVSPGGGSTHNCAGIYGGPADSMQVPISHCRKDSDGQVRQLNSVYLHQQDGWDKVPSSLSTGHTTLGVVSGHRHLTSFSTPARRGQPTGRCLVPPLSAKQGVGSSLSSCKLSFSQCGIGL